MCAARCGPKATRTANALLCVAGEAPHVDRRVGDFLRREAKRELEAASRRFAAELGVSDPADFGARSVEPLGLMLDDGRVVVFLAAHSGAGFRAQLSRRPRSGASRRDESFGRGSGGWCSACAPIMSALKFGSTCMAAICIATGCRKMAVRCSWQSTAPLAYPLRLVPAKAGTQGFRRKSDTSHWIPACTGMSGPRARWLLVESSSRSRSLFEYDLFGKPVSTFPDHALSAGLAFPPPRRWPTA